MPVPNIIIRPAVTLSDAEEVFALIEEFAKFESLPGPTDNAKWRFMHDGFERNIPRFQALLAYSKDDPKACGYAIYFDIYSTFMCKPCLYLEDLFILPSARGAGIGSAVLTHLISHAKTNGYGRVEWACLDWNKNAHKFYDKIGAHHHTEWMHYRMDEAAIDRYIEQLS